MPKKLPHMVPDNHVPFTMRTGTRERLPVTTPSGKKRSADVYRTGAPLTPAELQRLTDELRFLEAKFHAMKRGDYGRKDVMRDLAAKRGMWRNAMCNLGLRGQGIALTMGPSPEEQAILDRASYTTFEMENNR